MNWSSQTKLRRPPFWLAHNGPSYVRKQLAEDTPHGEIALCKKPSKTRQYSFACLSFQAENILWRHSWLLWRLQVFASVIVCITTAFRKSSFGFSSALITCPTRSAKWSPGIIKKRKAQDQPTTSFSRSLRIVCVLECLKPTNEGLFHCNQLAINFWHVNSLELQQTEIAPYLDSFISLWVYEYPVGTRIADIQPADVHIIIPPPRNIKLFC